MRSSCPGLSRLRGRSRFGEAKARASTFSVLHGVDGRDKPGHDAAGTVSRPHALAARRLADPPLDRGGAGLQQLGWLLAGRGAQAGPVIDDIAELFDETRLVEPVVAQQLLDVLGDLAGFAGEAEPEIGQPLVG